MFISKDLSRLPFPVSKQKRIELEEKHETFFKMDNQLVTIIETRNGLLVDENDKEYEFVKRKNIQAFIRCYENGVECFKYFDGLIEWYKNGRLHSPDNNTPAISFLGKYESYYKDGRVHRDNGPAIINYNSDGTIAKEEFYNDGYYHSNSGPSIKEENYEVYHHYGKRHREDGPAVVHKDKEGNVIKEEWWINGEISKTKELECQN